MDIVLVTYNSAKWIKGCFESLKRTKGLDEKLNIYVVDNNSQDDTCEQVNKYVSCQEFAQVTILKQQDNLGFGKANNIGERAGSDDIVCFINVDTEVESNTFEMVRKEVDDSSQDIGAWEMRQIPFEHPKLYDPLTRETTWMSGAAFAIRRSLFDSVGGFDEHIFMYAEDVDLSWRIRAMGYKIKYCPKAIIHHYSYQSANEVKPNQYLNSIKNNILLRYRFGDWKTILKGHKMFWEVYLSKYEPFPDAKKQLIQKYKEIRKDSKYFKKTRVKDKSVAKFIGWDYELIRDGAFVEEDVPRNDHKVSVIVRTCQRPTVLRETLISLRNQTYSNFEVVVVEDGQNVSESMIRKEFPELDIQYYATDEKKGRSYAGNLGVEKAKGEYINFLDDDDLFYADHIETLVLALSQTDCKAAYSFAYETPVDIKSLDPFVYVVQQHIGRHKQMFDKILLCHHNYLPIQTVMFSKELFNMLGGFDTSLDYLEDWDLWVRYMQMTDFYCVPKTTSLYKVPLKREEQDSRQKKLDEALQVVRQKHKGYKVSVSVADLARLGEESPCQTILRKFKFKQS